MNPLHLAVRYNNNADVIKVLIENGANINILDYNKETPLHCAIRSKCHVNVVRALIERGADINAANSD